jgi:alkylhydroperoxidase family enzyme
MGRDVGIAEGELRAILTGNHHELGPLERTCVEYALKVEANAVTGADVEALREAGVDDAGIVELTVLAGYYGMTARYLLALDVDLDEGKRGFDSMAGSR